MLQPVLRRIHVGQIREPFEERIRVYRALEDGRNDGLWDGFLDRLDVRWISEEDQQLVLFRAEILEIDQRVRLAVLVAREIHEDELGIAFVRMQRLDVERTGDELVAVLRQIALQRVDDERLALADE